jgi:hypothetical protein
VVTNSRNIHDSVLAVGAGVVVVNWPHHGRSPTARTNWLRSQTEVRNVFEADRDPRGSMATTATPHRLGITPSSEMTLCATFVRSYETALSGALTGDVGRCRGRSC